MSEQIDWSKAPEGADKYNTHNDLFYKGERPDLQVFMNEQWKPSAIIKSNELFVYRPAATSWSGEGLPPVGAVCEAGIPHTSGASGESRSIVWIEGRVIAYHEINGRQYAWFAEDDDGFYPPGVFEFRPIRTPEQIAADEREAAIERACADIEKRIEGFNVQLSYSLAIRATIEAMIDKGYRKP